MPDLSPSPGSRIPPIGFGTGPLGLGTSEETVATALEVGYRHIDTAQFYKTEEIIGRAVASSGLPRGAVFVTTKIDDSQLAADTFRDSVERSRERLQTEAIDLLLIHWPSFGGVVPMRSYLESLRQAQADGLARSIGVSNFPIGLIDEARAILGEGAIATNQVELHPYLQQRRLVAHCLRHGIRPTAYLPLARGAVADDPVIQDVAARHGATAAAVTLAFLLQQDIVVIPSSTSRANMQSNLRAASLTLDDAAMQAMAALDRGQRFVDPPKSPAWDPA